MRFLCLDVLIACFGMFISRIDVFILYIDMLSLSSERRLPNRSTRYCTLLRTKGE